MAEEQKNVEVPQEVKAEETVVAPAIDATEPAKEETTAAKPTEDAVKTDEAAAEDKPAEEKADATKEEVKPIEEGHLGHKAQGASFPKNFIPSKEFFFFGTDAYEPKSLSNYNKNEKSAATYHTNVAWASETGKGLLFSGDKKAPTGVINLADATVPDTEGPNKFSITTKGNKHSFKAASTAERDNWVAQLKLKIAEAQELVPVVTESETYKKTLESFKPAAPAKKEEKAAVPTDATEATKEESKEETKDETKAEEATQEGEGAKADKAESPRPMKSKRASFFGFFDKKAEEKKEEPKTEDKVEDKTETPEVAKATEEPVVATEEPAVAEEATKSEGEAETPKAEDKAAEEHKAESPKEKSAKRNSFFGGFLSKKEKKTTEAKTPDATEEPKDTEAAKTETDAPVIPPVEATTPLADAVNNDANAPAPVDAAEVKADATAAEPKKETKEKRKSSIPFLGKREKSPAPTEGEEKSPKSAFSKLRATIKGKTAPKAEDKPTEEAVKEETTAEGETAETKEEPATEAIKTEEAATEEPKKVDATEPKPENVATTTPVVTAAA